MPNVKVRTEPRDGTIYFMDGVGTSDTTYTYDMPQSEFTLQNTGTRRLIWSVGPYKEVLVEPGTTETRAIDAGVTSFTIRAQYHYQSFTMSSKETPVENPSLASRMDGLDTQLAETVKVVNVKNYGAKGDGTTNDSTSIQNAFNDAYLKGARVYFPKGKYRIENTITLPSEVHMFGESSTYQYGSQIYNTATSVLNTYCDPVFTMGGSATDVKQGKITVKNLAFSDNRVNSTLFAYINFYGGLLQECGFRSYGYVIKGVLNYLSRIQYCTFLDLRNSLLSNREFTALAGLTDSYINNNYINGSVYSTTTKLIDINFPNMSYIQNNFFDYAYNALNITGGNNYSITNNIFDYIYKAINIGTGSGYTVTNNMFYHIAKSNVNLWQITTPSEMQTNDWIGINIRYGSAYATIADNIGNSVEKLFSLNGSGYKFITSHGNKISGVTDKTKWVNLSIGKDAGYVDDGEGLDFQELQYREVATLPSVAGTSSTFKGQRLIYNGKVVRNNGSMWIDFMGTQVT